MVDATTVQGIQGFNQRAEGDEGSNLTVIDPRTHESEHISINPLFSSTVVAGTWNLRPGKPSLSACVKKPRKPVVGPWNL